MADGITISDGLIVLSTLAGPLLAVQAQKWIERSRSTGDRQRAIFETLMTTRGSRLHPDHVRALNQIDIEFRTGAKAFRREKNRTVVEAWKTYAGILNEDAKRMPEPQFQIWLQRNHDAFVALLKNMSDALGYSFSAEELRRGVYHPEAYWLAERRQEVLQDALGRVLHGDQALALDVRSFPQPTDDTVDQQTRLGEAFLGAFSSDGSIRVEMREAKREK